MAENLSIFGVEYSNVAGFKVLNTSGTTLAFPLASGTLDTTLPGTYDVASYAYAVTGGSTNNLASYLDNTLSGAVILPDDVTRIENSKFYSCNNLISIEGINVEYIGASCFAMCSRLETISFPHVKTVGQYGFSSCIALSNIYMPELLSAENSAFYRLMALENVTFPKLQSIGASAFQDCQHLAAITLPAVTTIYQSAFYRNYLLLSVYLPGSSVASLSNANAFASTPISGYTTATGGVLGSIFVPASLVDSYKTYGQWSYYSSRITAIV